LPGWQRFWEAHRAPDFEIVAIAMEHGGPAEARRYVEAARVSFPTLIDERGATSGAFGFKVVPNGALLDADGIIRYLKIGGFSVERPEDRAAVERFARGADPGPSPANDARYTLDPLTRELIDTRLRLGHVLISLGQRDAAVTEWRAALRRDPDNFVIRKQIWAALYPERFHPTIDAEWQKVQLAQERAEELAAGWCGPDGCPIGSKT
jgi:hypothetical protein